jgi:hypothetical protein
MKSLGSVTSANRVAVSGRLEGSVEVGATGQRDAQ